MQFVDDIRERLKLLGLDPSKAEEMVRIAQQSPMRKGAAVEPFAVQPQREWEEGRRRLQEQAKRLANILLNHVELTQAGTEMVYKYNSLRLTGKNNYTQAQAADAIGAVRTTLVAIEQGVRRPRLDELQTLAGLYGTTVNALLRRESASVDCPY